MNFEDSLDTQRERRIPSLHHRDTWTFWNCIIKVAQDNRQPHQSIFTAARENSMQPDSALVQLGIFSIEPKYLAFQNGRWQTSEIDRSGQLRN
jgi:hypothetical protein